MIGQVESYPKRYARVAGVMYLVIIGLGLFAALVRERIVVETDAARTASNIVAEAAMFRVAIAADLLTYLTAIPLTLLLYRLLKPVHRDLALLTVLLNLAQDAIGGMNVLNAYRPLQLLAGAEYLNVFSRAQLEAMALLSIRAYSTGFFLAMLFFGVCCMVLGYLIFRSGLLPKFIGTLVAIAGLCYFINSVASVVSPGISALLFPAIYLPAFVGELAFALWLLVKGINHGRWLELTSAPSQ